ncbi:MAG: pinensin family lanthipeptide [Bacteroidota bacterium]
MKKKNLKISQLQVESFVTDLMAENAETIKGGSYYCPPPTYTCNTSPQRCHGTGTGTGGPQTQQITACDITACNA